MTAILDIWEETGKRKATITEKGVRKYHREWRCKVDDPTIDGLWIVENAVGGPPLPPPMFWPYITEQSQDLGALCVNAEAAQEENPYLFTIPVDYSSESPNPAQGAEDPLQRPPRYVWGNEIIKQVATLDQDGLPYLSSAGGEFDPAIEDDVTVTVLTYTRNVDSWDFNNAPARVNCVNQAAWFGFGARTVRVAENHAQDHWEKGINYFEETFVLKMKSDGWLHKILDQDYYELIGGVKRLILDTAGRALQQPTLLDGAGRKLAAGGTPVFISRRPLADLDFSELNIP